MRWPSVFAVGFGVAEAVLRSMHGLGDDKKVAFESRLRHLQRLDLTPAVKTGKGTRGNYGAGELLNLALALELIELGLQPDRATRILKSKQDDIRRAFRELVRKDRAGTLLLTIDSHELQDGNTAVSTATLSDLTSRLDSEGSKGITRLLVVNLTTLVATMEEELRPYRWLYLSAIDVDRIGDVQAAIAAWADRDAEA